MPYSHSTSLVLRDPPPVVTVAFAHPAPEAVSSTRSHPVAGAGSQTQNRMLDGARTATLGHSRPFQAVMWGVPGQLSAGRPRFNARVGSASLSNLDINVHQSSRTRTRPTRPWLRVAAAFAPLRTLAPPRHLPRSYAALLRALVPPCILPTGCVYRLEM